MALTFDESVGTDRDGRRWAHQEGRLGNDGDDGPKERATRQTLVFLHIPKTAGTTLNRIIEAQYNPLNIYTIPGGHRVWSIERFKRLPDHRRRRLRVLKGHMGYGLHRYLPQPSTYFTMLRDPIDQVVSSYYYAISHRGHPLHRTVTERRMRLEEFVDLTPWGNNLQTKLIGGLAMAEIRPPDALAAARRGEFVSPQAFTGTDASEELLVQAKRNLNESFSVVGLLERFDESLAWMMIQYRWNVPYYQRFRKSTKRPTDDRISQAARQKIESLNALDMELYESGKRRFEQETTRHRDAIDVILKQFQNASPPSPIRARWRAACAWGRGMTSMVRSAT